MTKFSDIAGLLRDSPEVWIHKYGSNGKYYSEGDMICNHENMEYLEEHEDSPYFIKHCPNCGFFMTKRFEEIKKDD